MPGLTRALDLPGPVAHGPETTVLCVDDEPAYLDLVRTLLDEQFEVQTETDPTAAPGRLDGVDCVVSDYRMPELDGIELLEAVRERESRLPFVLLTGEAPREVADPVLAAEWTDYLGKRSVAASTQILPRRIHTLVGYRRAATVARRALAAVETARDGVAIVGADGRFEFVDRTYATRFGYDSGELVGRSWREVYPSAEIDRLESTALSVAEEGWRWSGTCVGHRNDGGTVTTRTTVTALGDGSFAVVVSGTEREDV